MDSNNNTLSEVKLITDPSEIKNVMEDDSIKKLFLKQHYNYECNSDNWGACKGQIFERVCVVLNPKTAELYDQGKLDELQPQTKSKFYVACTRTQTDLLFIRQNMIPKQYKRS
ncbi:MAG: hypothetical protein PHR19_09045 [Bacteroidales bacterium]|nr:hypothetical protein [Bacteroidales bacterium]